ncbi:MAG: hypothetical protein ACREIC_25805 [Limisphaerales bacterium]
MDAQSYKQLADLEVAERALRQNLHRHNQDETTRAHLERALAHVREAAIGEEGANVRSVNQLVRELTGMERFVESLQTRTDAPLLRP